MSIITRTLEKIKKFGRLHFEEIGVSLAVVLVAISSFFLGKSSAVFDDSHHPISIEQYDRPFGEATSTPAGDNAGTEDKSGEVVATKNGKKYYYPWCPTVARLNDSAKRFFPNVAAAEAAGLTPAANCAGMNSK